jgi:hypothetical protein
LHISRACWIGQWLLPPHCAVQLQKMPPADASILLAQLFDRTGADVNDSVSVSHSEALFATADIDYNQELAVLEALLDQGMTAPKFAAPGRVRAGRSCAGGCLSTMLGLG